MLQFSGTTMPNVQKTMKKKFEALILSAVLSKFVPNPLFGLGSGSGRGYGDGSGYGDGYDDGSGSGDGYDDGDGRGYGSGSGSVKTN